MSVYLEKVSGPFELPDGADAIIGKDGFVAFRFFDDCVYDQGKGYNTYKIVSESGTFVLKKYGCPEDLEAEVKHYSLLKGLPVPKLLGVFDGSILMEFVEGDDLKFPDDAGIIEAARSLAAVMNAYPMGRGYETARYDKYLMRLERRAEYLNDEPELREAFVIFFRRQKEIPLTLSNSDLLPINVLYDGKKATIIDWEFGGFMPYALDIARFIAHTTEDRSVTSFKMSKEQKRLFIDTVYSELQEKPPREVYERDLLLARYNECIEILEYYLNDPSVDRDAVFGLYYPMAKRLAKEILGL